MSKVHWKTQALLMDDPIFMGMKKLEEQEIKVLLVVDTNAKLYGTLTDGDIRRGLLKGRTIEDPIKSVMNSKPITCIRGINEFEAYDLLERHTIFMIPVLDNEARVVDIHTASEAQSKANWDNPVIILAGGKGERLMPLTKDMPKPLLHIGNKPILETILENLVQRSFTNFYFSVNYKSQHIKNHFENGKKWGVNIRYLEEDTKLGTAGCLSLLTEEIDKPILVMNGDLLTTIDFRSLIYYHQEHNNIATVCVREHSYQIPYGVVKLDGLYISDIEEKPRHSFFVNAGIYVLDPKCIPFVPKNKYFDMTTLLRKIIKQNETVSSYPIHEYWIDIGQRDDYERAKLEYNLHF